MNEVFLSENLQDFGQVKAEAVTLYSVLDNHERLRSSYIMSFFITYQKLSIKEKYVSLKWSYRWIDQNTFSGKHRTNKLAT